MRALILEKSIEVQLVTLSNGRKPRLDSIDQEYIVVLDVVKPKGLDYEAARSLLYRSKDRNKYWSKSA